MFDLKKTIILIIEEQIWCIGEGVSNESHHRRNKELMKESLVTHRPTRQKDKATKAR